MPFVATITKSLLDREALGLISRQIWAVHRRLSVHTQGNLPSAVELAIALRMHLEERDAQRAAAAARSPAGLIPPSIPSDAPPIELLTFLLDVAEATYFLANQQDLFDALRKLHLSKPLAFRSQAEKWAPGFFLTHDRRRDLLILAIRGSRDVGDLITNLSTDSAPFLNGTAHQGIARAAHHLHTTLRPTLAHHLTTLRPRNGLVVLGHSLGGAASAALVMLLHETPAPRSEYPFATAALRLSRCYSFAAPPFLSREVAMRAARMPIYTIVYGLDIIPRLSAASIDRLLRRLAKYDWTSRIGSRINSAVTGALRGVGLPIGENRSDGIQTDEQNDRNMNTTTPEENNPRASSSLDHGTLANVSGTIANVANTALQTRGLVPSTALGAAVNAALFLTRSLGRGVQGSAQRVAHDQATMGIAERFGMSERDADELLSESLPDVMLAGEVWHVVVRFQSAEEADEPLTAMDVTMVKRSAKFFRDVEVSAWMAYDHYPKAMRGAFMLMLQRPSQHMPPLLQQSSQPPRLTYPAS